MRLREHLGELVTTLAEHPLEETIVARRATVQPRANWKNLIENFLEYYHLPAVHPALCAVSGVDEHVRTQGELEEPHRELPRVLPPPRGAPGLVRGERRRRARAHAGRTGRTSSRTSSSTTTSPRCTR